MKKTMIVLFASLFLPFISFAQRTVEITPFGGYVFPGTMQAEGGDIRFIGNGQYGGIVSIAVSPSVDVDLIYNRSDTKAQINLPGYRYNEIPLSINYIHVGFTKNFRINTIVSPFVGYNLGGCMFYPKVDNTYETWFFSMGLDAGAKIYFAKHFGLRLQAQAMMPIQGTGFTMFVGTGGASGGVSVYSTLVQFGFTGGLIFRLGHVQ
ncbi:MAG: hypothetical protein PHF97_03305 [Bacteroidales bacterium]|nr:hypothetical protein [Bacteroidales bacterium]MDD4602822.1 hypothetical protein [Bacteroidales bacterium]